MFIDEKLAVLCAASLTWLPCYLKCGIRIRNLLSVMHMLELDAEWEFREVVRAVSVEFDVIYS